MSDPKKESAPRKPKFTKPAPIDFSKHVTLAIESNRKPDGSLGKRVRQLMEEKGVKDYETADAIGAAHSSFSVWLKQGRIPKMEYRLKLANYLETTIDYLDYGIVAEAKVNARSFPLARNMDDLKLIATVHNQSIITALTYKELGYSKLTDEQNRHYRNLQPSICYHTEASAGSFAIELIADTMEPDLPIGTQVLIDHRKKPEPGKFLSVLIDGELDFRRWMPLGNKQHILTYTNPIYRDQTMVKYEGEIWDIWLGTATYNARNM